MNSRCSGLLNYVENTVYCEDINITRTNDREAE